MGRHESTFEPLMLIDDEPVSSHKFDKLDILPFAKVVAGTAVGTNGPFTIGVFGSWGTGKTSVLMQAKSLIELEYKEVVTVWFNAWKYEKEPQPLIPLLTSIVAAIEEKNTKTAVSKKARAALRAVGNALLALAYGVSIDFGLNTQWPANIRIKASGKDFFNGISHFEQHERDALLEKTQLMSIFDRLEGFGIDSDIEKSIPKIIVFIDDLDRTHPNSGLYLLDAVKLALSHRGFVFVLAADRPRIENYLRKRYREEFGDEDYGHSGASYFDKIVQLPLPLPPHKQRFESYVRKLLQHSAIQSDQELRSTFELIVDVLVLGGASNPRTVVRLINNLLVDWRLWQLVQMETDPGLVQMSAVSRTLRQNLGEPLYLRLVRDNEMCEMIARGGTAELRRQLSEAPMGEATDQIRYSVLQRIELNEDLISLLRHEAAKAWLTDHTRRNEVESFLVSERKESFEDKHSEDEIIDAAIRKHLGKPANERITDSERSRLRTLDLAHAPITDSALEHVHRLSELQTLILSGTQVRGPGISHLKGMIHLARLDLTGTQITDRGLEHLEDLVGLWELNLTATAVTDAGLEHIRVLSSYLQDLNLTRTNVTDEGLRHLGYLFSLHCLRLDHTRITGAGLKHLAPLSGQLVQLHLNDTLVNDAELEHVVGLKRLFRLTLRATKVTDVGLVHLMRLEDLDGLNLEETKVTDAGLEHLGSVKGLTWLGLRATQVTDTGLVHLASFQELEGLNLDETRVTDAGLKHLRDVKKGLTWLSIRATGLTDAGLAHLESLKSLDRLYLNDTTVTDAGLAHLESLRNLRELDLTGCLVTEAGKNKLRRALEKTTIK